MSFILQALAQSERERRNADTPDLTQVFEVEPPSNHKPRHRTLILGGLLLLINVTIIIMFMLFGNFQFSSSDEPSTTAHASNTTPQVTATPPATADGVETPLANKNTTSANNPASMVAVTDLPKDNTPSQDATVQLKSFEKQADDHINKAAAAQQELPIEEPPVVELPLQNAKPVVAKPTTVAKATQPAITAKQPVAQELDLSDIERVNTLSGIDMSVHVYSDKVAERFVFINGQEYHEGDRLSSEGATLTAITPNGAVLDLGGRRVLLNRIQ